MLTTIRTTSIHPDFVYLTALFDDYLIDIDGDEKDFFAQYNQIPLKNVIICCENEKAIGCGAFKQHENTTVELKRMFVLPEYRGKGAANLIINELELWAFELGNQTAVLETAIKLPDAIRLYSKKGYSKIENYGQYVGVAASYCMKKILK